MSDRINILYQSDNNYVPFMGVSLYSLLLNSRKPKELDVYVIDDNISKSNKELLSSLESTFGANIIFLNISELSKSVNVRQFANYIGMRKNTHSYYKLFMAELLPLDVKKIIYIDCDTLVLNDLGDLFHTDLQGNNIAMVYDSLVYKAKKSLGLGLDDVYYNSGVILVDVNSWRTNNCEVKLIDNIKEHGQYGTVDQDVLNLTFYGEIMTLPMRYNVQPHHLDFSLNSYFRIYPRRNSYYDDREIMAAVEKPAIIHFLRYMGKSPWHVNNYHPASKLFDEYLEKSPWKDYRKQKKKISVANHIQVVLYKVLPRTWYLRIFVIYHEHMIMKSNRKYRKHI